MVGNTAADLSHRSSGAERQVFVCYLWVCAPTEMKTLCVTGLLQEVALVTSLCSLCTHTHKAVLSTSGTIREMPFPQTHSQHSRHIFIFSGKPRKMWLAYRKFSSHHLSLNIDWSHTGLRPAPGSLQQSVCLSCVSRRFHHGQARGTSFILLQLVEPQFLSSFGPALHSHLIVPSYLAVATGYDCPTFIGPSTVDYGCRASCNGAQLTAASPRPRLLGLTAARYRPFSQRTTELLCHCGGPLESVCWRKLNKAAQV